MATSPPPKKKRKLTDNISTDSSTAQYTGGSGTSNVTQTSSTGSRGGGGGGGSSEKTIAVNPITYQPDGSSTFRVPESQVGKPPQQSSSSSNYKFQEGESGTLKTADGRTIQVTAKEQSSFSKVQSERESFLRGSGGRNLSNRQLAELQKIKQREQPITIALDTKAVEEFNARNPKAKEFFKTRETKTEPSKTQVKPETRFYAPTTKTQLQETQPRGNLEFQEEPIKPKSLFPVSERQEEERTTQGLETFSNLPEPFKTAGQASVLFTAGIVTGTRKAIELPFQIVDEFKKNPLEAPANVATGIISGTADFIGEGVDAITSGDIKKVSYLAGEFKAIEIVQTKTFGAVKEVASIPKNIKNAENALIFREATEGQPLDTNFKFEVKRFDERGQREGFIPQDISQPTSGLAGTNPIVPSLRSPEIQTQLVPKKLPEERSIFAPEPYVPLSFLELAKKEPQLAKEIAKESGQMVFNPNEVIRIRDRTPEERLQIAREQAGITKDSQLTFKQVPDFTIVKDAKGEVKLLVKEPNTKTNLLFATDPLTASILFLDQNKATIVSDLKGTARKPIKLLVEGADNIKKNADNIKASARFPLLYDARETRIGETINAQNSFLINQPTTKPNSMLDLNARQKNITETASTLELGSRSRSKQRIPTDTSLRIAQTPIQEVQPDLIQSSSIIQTTEQQIPKLFQPTPRTQPRPKETPETITNIFATPSKEKAPKSQSRSFKAQLRRKGIFQTIGTTTDLTEAKGIASFGADTTAGASIRILDQDNQAIELTPTSRFRKSKKEKGVLVELNKFRIDTGGERQQITQKGIFTKKNKNIFGGK